MKKDNDWLYHNLILALIAIAIVMTVAAPIMRVIFAPELKELEDGFFEFLGIGGLGRFAVMTVLVGLFVYFKARPHIKEAKRNKRPVIGKGVLWFGAIAFIISAFFIFLGVGALSF